MICPRCQTRNELGAGQCVNCGAPFTRRAARRVRPEQGSARHDYNYQRPQQQAYPQRAAVPAEEYPRHRYPRRQTRQYRRGVGPGNRAVGGLIAILIIIIVVVSGAALLGSGDTSERLSEGVAETFSGLVGAGSDDGQPDVEVPETPAEPQGDQTLVLTEAELNERIAGQSDAFSPAEDVSVELGDGTVTVHFRAYGVNGTYHGTLTTRDGVPVVADSTVDGALGWVVSSSQIDDVLNQEMASAVAEQQVSVESVHVHPGEMIFGISG